MDNVFSSDACVFFFASLKLAKANEIYFAKRMRSLVNHIHLQACSALETIE